MFEGKEIFTVSGPTTSGRPYLNENQIGAITTSSTFLTDKRTLMNWIKRTAEAIGILRQISMDVITRITFIALPQEQKKGRPPAKNPKEGAEEKAAKFAKDNHLKQQLRAAMIEGPALGDAYLWMGKVSLGEKKEILKKVFKQVGIELKESEIEAKAIDEDYVGEKTIQYVASASMNIEVDSSGTKIKSYVQRTALGFGPQTFPSATIRGTFGGTVTGQTRRWFPDQIIHYKFMELDGKVHGFTPMQSVFPIMKTLGAIKDYHGHYFESAILPDIVFNFEEDDPNSVHHEKMRQLLEEWWNNKRRSPAITTGKFDVKEFNKWNKDMEFRMLAIYYTGVMAFSIGMPLEKIRAILGGEMKSTTGGSDISNTDYQRNIYDMQDDWEQLLNTQFFNEEFGVNIKFERSAARDEVAEVLRDSQKTNWIDQMFQKDWIKEDNKIDLLSKEFPSIPKDYWNPNPEPELPMMGGMMPSSKALPKGQASQAHADEKREQQKPQAKNKPPMGV